jgi:hypothetical protein
VFVADEAAELELALRVVGFAEQVEVERTVQLFRICGSLSTSHQTSVRNCRTALWGALLFF